MSELSPEVLFFVALASSVIVWAVKFAMSRGANIPSAYLTGGVYVVSGVLAFFFAPISLPAFPPFVDLASFVPALLQYIADLLVPLSAFAGFAALVYQALLKRVLEGLAARMKAAAG